MKTGFLFIASMLILGAAPSHADEAARLGPTETLLSVRAEGYASGKPDVMAVRAGAVSVAKTSQEAVQANNEIVTRILENLKAKGIPFGDIRTEDFAVEPVMRRDDDGDRDAGAIIAGYKAKNELRITLRDLSRAGEMISAMYEAGANDVEGPYFSFSDPAPVIRAAERAAIAEARAEAENYAAALGMRVVRVARVHDREVDYEEEEYGSGVIVVTGSRIIPTPIEPGDLEVTAEVQIEFVLQPK